MVADYIAYIRQKVGHDRIFLNFAVGILADDEGRVLLQHRADKKNWGLPGGALELGESSVEALRREFLEETGILVEPVNFLNVYTKQFDVYPNGDQAQSIVFLYEVKAKSLIDIRQFDSEESLALRFCSQADISQLELVNDQHALMLDEYFRREFAMGH